MTTEMKLVVLGAGGVGKSCVTVLYVQGIFIDKYDPTIEDSYRKLVSVDGIQVMLELLDTAGTEQFTAMRDLYMKNGHGFLLAYSVTALSTYQELPDIYQQILRVKDVENIPLVLIGNKADLPDARQVPTERGQALAKELNNCPFFETSAKSGMNVDAAFQCLMREIIKTKGVDPGKSKKNSMCSLL